MCTETQILLNWSHALLVRNYITKSTLLRDALGYNCIQGRLGDLNCEKSLKKKSIIVLLEELTWYIEDMAMILCSVFIWYKLIQILMKCYSVKF